VVSGWAIDSDTADPTQIAVSVDGETRGSVTANANRPDVGRAYPGYGDQHGFALAIADISGGLHRVCVTSGGTPPGTTSELGCRVVTVRSGNPFGNLEVASPVGLFPEWITGWVIDPDTTNPADVHLYIDGRWAGRASGNLIRADVARVFPGFGVNHGFRFPLDGLAAGPHTACAYGINIDGGTVNSLLGCQRFTTPGGNPFGNFEALRSGVGRLSASGWVIDPDVASPTDVHVYVDGRFRSTSEASGSRPDVAIVYPGYGDRHGFTVTVDGLSPGIREVCVFGINVGSGNVNTLLGCRRGQAL
jgi:hypothetical protein